jgi:hypothetical protein
MFWVRFLLFTFTLLSLLTVIAVGIGGGNGAAWTAVTKEFSALR